MSEGVDAEGAVVQQGSADAKSPHEELSGRGSEFGVVGIQE